MKRKSIGFGKRLKRTLANCEMQQNELAKRLDVRAATVGAWTKGVVPEGETIQRIAKETRVDLHWLLTGEHYNREEATEAEIRLTEILDSLERPIRPPGATDEALSDADEVDEIRGENQDGEETGDGD